MKRLKKLSLTAFLIYNTNESASQAVSFSRKWQNLPLSATKFDKKLDPDDQIKLKFPEGWIHCFKNSRELRSYKLNGKIGDADKAVTDTDLHKIRAKVADYVVQQKHGHTET